MAKTHQPAFVNIIRPDIDKMQVGAYLRVHVYAFLPFSSVAIEGENLW